MSPLVTAVITTCGRPQHIAEALASVHAETYGHVECLVIDDADRSGVGYARNAGLAAAGGEFVIFLDDDDVALPHRISTLVEAAVQNRADVCFGLTRRIGGPAWTPNVPTHLLSFGEIGFCDILACAPHINAVLVRTAALRAVGGFDAVTAHFDDWSTWLRLADRNVAMWCVPEVVAEWRIHDAGLSGEVIQLRAMKSRLLALFDRLHGELSDESARGIAIARRIVAAADVRTYDDYVRLMAVTRRALHDDGQCLGRRMQHHQSAQAPWVRAQSLTLAVPLKYS